MFFEKAKCIFARCLMKRKGKNEMELKSLLFIAAASACLAAFAYTWTGGANDGGLWTTPQNWGVTSGYPQAADDPVIFNGDATVSLNTGAQTDIA